MTDVCFLCLPHYLIDHCPVYRNRRTVLSDPVCSFLREGRSLYYSYSACPRAVRLSSGARPLKPVCIQYVPVIQPR